MTTHNVLTVNTDFIIEEVTKGHIGLYLSPEALQAVNKAQPNEIHEALHEVFGDPSHPLHVALDQFTIDVIEKLAKTTS